MRIKNQAPTGLTAEINLIPAWAWVAAGIGFLGMQLVFNVALAAQTDAPPAWARTLLGLLVGLVLACYLLLIGYVYRDAARRGMSRALWMAVCILVPNALGIILYFILRQPIAHSCPQCGQSVQPAFNFCPQCNCKLNPSCPQCQHMVQPGDAYCANCGASLAAPSPATNLVQSS